MTGDVIDEVMDDFSPIFDATESNDATKASNSAQLTSKTSLQTSKRNATAANLSPPKSTPLLHDLVLVKDVLNKLNVALASPDLPSHVVTALASSLALITSKLLDELSSRDDSNVIPSHQKPSTKPTPKKARRESRPSMSQSYENIYKNPTPIDADEKERKRSIVIAGVPESNDPKPSSRSIYDRQSVTNIMDDINVEAPISEVYRLPKRGNSRGPALLKVIFPSSLIQRNVLKHARNLRNSTVESIKNCVYIRPSLTAEERQIDANLREKVRQLRKHGNMEYVVYKSQIVKKFNHGETPVAVSDSDIYNLLQNFH